MLICNKCGKTSKRGKFCVYCGGELSEFFKLKTAENNNAPKGTCPQCGKEYTTGGFCVFCGTKLDNDTHTEVEAVIETAPVVETAVAEEPVIETAPIVEPEPVNMPENEPVVENNPVIDNTPVTETSAEEENRLKCSECGKLHSKGKFCVACGGALVPADAPVVETEIGKLACAVCGKIHDRGKFCTACGGELKPVGTADETSANAPSLTKKPEPAPVIESITATETPAGGLKCEVAASPMIKASSALLAVESLFLR